MNHKNHIASYLKRINFNNEIRLNRDTLFSLQRSHLLSVPFENLDIYYGNEIKLSIDAIFEKIVINGRGGFCYELNGLFYYLLKTLGFKVKLISGKVYDNEGRLGEEYDHLAIIADIDQRQYLLDVGFGKFSYEPLEIKTNIPIADNFGEFQFDLFKRNYLRINVIKNKKLIPLYTFLPKERAFSEFEGMCKYHQTSKDSHFTHKRVISIMTNDGRITLNDSQVKILKGETVEVINFTIDEFNSKLLQYFNIKL